MNAIIKELSHDETLMVNGGEKTYYGGTLPEVVCVGHKKTFWDKILEYIQSVPSFDWRAEYQSGGFGPY